MDPELRYDIRRSFAGLFGRIDPDRDVRQAQPGIDDADVHEQFLRRMGIGAMLLVQGNALDYEYLERGAAQLDVAEVWAELLAECRRASDGRPEAD